MSTKRRGYNKAEKEEIIDNAYRLARSGLLSNYLKMYAHIIPENDKKYLVQSNKINKTGRELKEFRRFSERLSGLGLLGYATDIIRKNLADSVTERIGSNYMRSELESIIYDYYDSKIKELNAGRNDAKLVLDEIFKNTRAEK